MSSMGMFTVSQKKEEALLQNERSRALNRFLARRILIDRIERIQKGRASLQRQKIEKIKRQKRRRSKRAQEKVLRLKHIQSEKKALRSKAPLAEE
ncbi:hypothetical protein ES707_19646 [subsurface metagenome]